MKRFMLLIAVAGIVAACNSSKLDFEQHRGWLCATTYSLSGDGISVYYYGGDCPHPVEVLRELQRRVDIGAVDWEQFRFTAADTAWVRAEHGDYAIDNWASLGNSRRATEYLYGLCDSIKAVHP